MCLFQDQTQRCGDIIFHAFDPVIVQLSLDQSNVQHEKLVFKLVKPIINGFSVPPVGTESPEKSSEQQNISNSGDVINEQSNSSSSSSKRKDKSQNKQSKKKKKK